MSSDKNAADFRVGQTVTVRADQGIREGVVTKIGRTRITVHQSSRKKTDMSDLMDLGPFPPAFILRALEREHQKATVEDGIKAAVGLYYDNFTDATEMESDAVETLRTLVEMVGVLDTEADALIASAENKLNAEGLKDSDGDPRWVSTNLGSEE